MDKKEIINKLADSGCLISPDLVYTLENEQAEKIVKFLNLLNQRIEKPLVLTNSFFIEVFQNEYKEISDERQVSTSLEIDSKQEVLAMQEGGELQVKEAKIELQKPTQELEQEKEAQDEKNKDKDKIEKLIKKVNSIKILYSYIEDPKSITVDDFSNYFRTRYIKLREMLALKPELENLISINKINYQQKDFSIIGMVQEKRITKNGNVFIVLEDLTGTAKVIVSSRNQELYDRAENLVQDEVIGIRGRASNQFVFGNNLVQMDFFGKERIQGGKGYALFISDLHIGSNKFLGKQFNNFIRWINLKVDSKQKEIAEKCKYLFVLGDIVDGIGVFPDQAKELTIKDLNEQYEEAAYLISQIRDDIKIIMIPGNHDATSQSVPQPVFDTNYASPLFKIKNVLNLSNPSYVNIASTEKFKGYDVLLYHGYSLNYFANNVRSLINKGYKNPSLLQSYLLKRRHLAPTHGSTPYLPIENDPLFIDKIPDVFATGDLHKLSTSYQNNVALIACSCWQDRTPFQIKVGHEPEPCKVPAFDLEKNTVRVLDFS